MYGRCVGSVRSSDFNGRFSLIFPIRALRIWQKPLERKNGGSDGNPGSVNKLLRWRRKRRRRRKTGPGKDGKSYKDSTNFIIRPTKSSNHSTRTRILTCDSWLNTAPLYVIISQQRYNVLILCTWKRAKGILV